MRKWLSRQFKRATRYKAVRYGVYLWLCLAWIPIRYLVALSLGLLLGVLLAVREATEEAVDEYRTVAYVFRKDSSSNIGDPKCQNPK